MIKMNSLQHKKKEKWGKLSVHRSTRITNQCIKIKIKKHTYFQENTDSLLTEREKKMFFFKNETQLIGGKLKQTEKNGLKKNKNFRR